VNVEAKLEIHEWITSDGCQLWCSNENCKWSTFLERTEDHLDEIQETVEEHLEFHLKAKKGRCNFCGKKEFLDHDGFLIPHHAYSSSYGGEYSKWKSMACRKGGYLPSELIHAASAIYFWGKELDK